MKPEHIPDRDGPWVSLEEARGRALIVSLVEDMLDGDLNPPMHPTTARATEAVLVATAEQTLPGILLADGHVVLLDWPQMLALRQAFGEFFRLIDPTAKEPARACVVLPK